MVTLPEQLVVTGTRSPRPTSSLPTTVDVLPRERIAASPGATTDAVLLAVPSVQTFRRSTSLAADPSSQGLSLRGIGPGAVSRALLLVDGVPANDPFAGWIPWRALPRLGLDRIEIAPGGASALYGTFALGGVVALVPRPVTGSEVEVESAGGALGTFSGAARVAHRAGGVGVAVEGDGLRTDGYAVVAPADRGPVDGRAGADHAAGTARVRWDASSGLALTAGGTLFSEAQDGGTRYTRASASLRALRAGLDLTGDAGRLEVVLHGAVRRFDQDRARIGPDRGSESLASVQRVPSRDLGASVVWAPPRLGGHALGLGADLRAVAGDSRDALFPAAPGPTSLVSRTATATQLLGGAFAEDSLALAPGLELGAALRLDGWRNAARTSVGRADGSLVSERRPARDAAQLSPRLAVLWRPAAALALRASAYRAFRAPTPNELYRTFQVGTVITAPEPGLAPETLTGAELGPELALPGGVRARATGFWSVLHDPITIVTLPAPLEDGATRRRANLGRARMRGIEAELSGSLAPGLSAVAAWTFVEARVVSAPGHPELVGHAVPQDPAHRATVELSWERAGALRATASVSFLSRQYEDDRNTLPMAGYALWSAAVSRRLARGVEAFAAAENLLDRRYLVGRAGVDTVGAPRTVRAGLRVGTER